MQISKKDNQLYHISSNPSLSHNSKKITVPPLGEIKIQNHHDNEVWLIHSGSGILYSDTKRLEINQDDYIEFLPFDYHFLKNLGDTDLVFTTFWYVDWNAVNSVIGNKFINIPHKNILIGTAFPTPNGPLHLGHLSGPYLLADIMKKYYYVHDIASYTYSGTFGHLNHIDRTAKKQTLNYDSLVDKSELAITNDLKLFKSEYDSFLYHNSYEKNNEFIKCTNEFIEKLLSSDLLLKKQVSYPFSELNNEFVSESYISGKCPNCNNITIGVECEKCGLFQDEINLIEPYHSDTKENLEGRNTNRLYLRIDDNLIDEIIVDLYQNNLISHKIAFHLLKQYKGKNLLNLIPVSNFRERGIVVFENQKLSMPFERAIRAYYNIIKFKNIDYHLFFCGMDNFCASGILISYILRVIGIPHYKTPTIIINQLSNLEGEKFSTSRNHAIWASDFLHKNSPELVKLYLAKIFNKCIQSNFSVKEFNKYSLNFVNLLKNIVLYSNDLLKLINLASFEAGQWTHEDMLFYKEINNSLISGMNWFSICSPNLAVCEIENISNALYLYCKDSKELINLVDTDYIRTRVSLQLYGLKILAFAIYPILTELSQLTLNALNISIKDYYKESIIVNKFGNINFEDTISYLNQYIIGNMYERS